VAVFSFLVLAEIEYLNRNRHGHVIRVCENAVMNDRFKQNPQTLIIVFACFLALVVAVFLYVTGGKLPGTTNSPTAESRGQLAQ